MNHVLIIAAREVREKKMVYVVSAFVALFTFFIAFGRESARRAGGGELIGAIGSVGAVNMAAALAIMLGATFIGKDLGDRRLSFYLSRPVSAASIWFGKLIGALVVVAISFSIIFLPAVAAGWKTWDRAFFARPGSVAGTAAIVSLLLLLVSHVVGTMVRSRSAIALVDVVAATLVGAACWMIFNALFEVGALELLIATGKVSLAALLAILVATGAWQVAAGRADIRRSHLEMSKFLWTAIAIVVIVLAGYVAWVFAADPEDLVQPSAALNPRGDWAIVSGAANFRGDYRPQFLLNVSTGQSVDLPAWPAFSPEFTPDGSAAITYAPFRKTTSGVVVHRIGRDDKPRQTSVRAIGNVVLSADLRRLAVVDRRGASIHEIDSDRLVASAALPGGVAGREPLAFFVTPDLLRIIAINNHPSPVLRVFELDAAKRQIVQTGSWSAKGRTMWARASRDGSTLVAFVSSAEPGHRATVLDGRSAQPLDTFDASIFGARILNDGRIAAITGGSDGVLEIRGATPVRIPLGARARGYVAAEMADGRLVLVLLEGTPEKPRAETVVVDLKRNAIINRVPNLRPLPPDASSDPRTPAANTTGELIVSEPNGALSLWNVATGAKRPLIRS